MAGRTDAEGTGEGYEWHQTDRTPTTSPVEDNSAQATARIPGDYKVEKLVLLSPNIDAEIDLTPTFDTISIFEDISTPYLLWICL